jgi:hypothetical protein
MHILFHNEVFLRAYFVASLKRVLVFLHFAQLPEILCDNEYKQAFRSYFFVFERECVSIIERIVIVDLISVDLLTVYLLNCVSIGSVVYTNYIVQINRITSLPVVNLKQHLVFGYVIKSALNLPNLVYQHKWIVKAQKIEVHFAVSMFGEVFSWGANSTRWLGHGGDVPTTPKQIETLANYYVKEMKCSKLIEGNDNPFFSVALTKEGKVFTWVSLHIC